MQLQGKLSAPIILGRDHHDVSELFTIQRNIKYIRWITIHSRYGNSKCNGDSFRVQLGYQYITEVVSVGE